MPGTEPTKKLRGRQTYLPQWWLDELAEQLAVYKQQLEDADERFSWQRLADELTQVAGRALNGKRWGWDRKTVERFAVNLNPTEELVDACCKRFPALIKPTFVANSREEAAAFSSVAARFRIAATPARLGRLGRLQAFRSEKEQNVGDTRQSDSLDSRDASGSVGYERAGRGRRSRRVD